jgi:hypothetical protein
MVERLGRLMNKKRHSSRSKRAPSAVQPSKQYVVSAVVRRDVHFCTEMRIGRSRITPLSSELANFQTFWVHRLVREFRQWNWVKSTLYPDKQVSDPRTKVARPLGVPEHLEHVVEG